MAVEAPARVTCARVSVHRWASRSPCQGVSTMLSILAFPKPFRGHIATIQRNAISSWTRLRPQCDIFLFGDDEGTAEVAKEFGVCHVPEMARNEYGTPLLSDV